MNRSIAVLCWRGGSKRTLSHRWWPGQGDDKVQPTIMCSVPDTYFFRREAADLPRVRCNVVASIAAENSNGGTSQAAREVPQVLHLLCANLAFTVGHSCRWHGDLLRHFRPAQSRPRSLHRPRNNKCADQNQFGRVQFESITAVGRTENKEGGGY
jgi:hypothetical protein